MERDNYSISSFNTNLHVDSGRHCRRTQRRRLRRQRLKAKLRRLEEEQDLSSREITILQRQQLDREDKLRHCRNELQALRAHQIEQQRQIQLLQEEVRKLRTIPTVIGRSVHFFLQELGRLEQQQPQLQRE